MVLDDSQIPPNPELPKTAPGKANAEQFIREVTTFASQQRIKRKIHRDFVDLKIRVEVRDSVTYDEHEDED